MSFVKSNRGVQSWGRFQVHEALRLIVLSMDNPYEIHRKTQKAVIRLIVSNDEFRENLTLGHIFVCTGRIPIYCAQILRTDLNSTNAMTVEATAKVAVI